MLSSKRTIQVPPEAINGSMSYFESVVEVKNDDSLLAFIRVIERAWVDFGLSGVLCVNNIPTTYFKEVNQQLSDAEYNDLQKRFWNQGVAHTLVVADPKTVRIFSGLAEPQRNEVPLSEATPSLVTTITTLEFAKNIAAFCQATSTGAWYKQNAPHYKADSSVDAYLLNNLVELHKLLTKPDKESGTPALENEIANALIGRVLFVCYLVDRRICALPGAFKNKSLNVVLLELQDDNEAINFIYDLFAHLKGDFNGSMFDQDLSEEKRVVKPFHIQKIRDFLDGQKLSTTQRNLGFWAYDFKLIPVETISAIYEEFLANENLRLKKETGAFYTPRFLAEMVIDIAVEGASSWKNLRYLDPCCGSGIFLVTLFNRLATRWLLDHPECDADPEGYLRKAEALLSILATNIRGVDINPTACHLACLSLYIAFLDCLLPDDINTYVIKTKRKLPRLLAKSNTQNDHLNIPVIYNADFLADNKLVEESFDCLIGNPPWEGRSAKQLALKIVEHAKRYLVTGGEGCLLLPSKVFLNLQSNAFQYGWFNQVTVERVVQLADYSKILFEHAKCPSMIVRYRNQKLTDNSHYIKYETPKFHPSARRRGLITISSHDHKWILQAQLRDAAKKNKASVLWKRSLWGTGRDLRLLAYFEVLPKLKEHIDVLSELRKSKAERTKPWAIGQGMKPYRDKEDKAPDRDLKKMPWPLKTPFISSSDLSGTYYISDDDFTSLGEHLIDKKYRLDKLYSSPPQELFTPPFILINQGYSKAAFCNFEAVFQDSLQSISGPIKDKDLLLFLTAYLNSDLAKYILFHSAANWGTERDKVHQDELLMLPFPLPEDAPAENAIEIIKTIADRMRHDQEEQSQQLEQIRQESCNLFEVDEDRAKQDWAKARARRTRDMQSELAPLIYEYFGLHLPQIMLIEDTINIFDPSATPNDPDRLQLQTLQDVTSNNVPNYQRGLAVYAETLIGTLNNWSAERGSSFRVSPSGTIDETSGLAMVTLSLGNQEFPMITTKNKKSLCEWIKRGFDACTRETSTIRSERDLLWFDKNHIHIIRPSTLIHWTRTAALNDADTIYGQIAQARRVSYA